MLTPKVCSDSAGETDVSFCTLVSATVTVSPVVTESLSAITSVAAAVSEAANNFEAYCRPVESRTSNLLSLDKAFCVKSNVSEL